MRAKWNSVSGFCVTAAFVATTLMLTPSKSYAQCPVQGCDIAGQIVVAEPGGSANIAVGFQSMLSNTGTFNTGVGNLALQNNTTGSFNTAEGNSALQFNTTGDHDTAVGTDALVFNTTGGDNSAVGETALFANTTGSLNTAMGFQALSANTIGSSNTALGNGACLHVTTGKNVMCLGATSGPAANVAGPATYVAGVFNIHTGGSNNPLVCIDKTGKLGTKGCALNGTPTGEQQGTQDLQQTIQSQAAHIADLEQRLSALESLVARK